MLKTSVAAHPPDADLSLPMKTFRFSSLVAAATVALAGPGLSSLAAALCAPLLQRARCRPGLPASRRSMALILCAMISAVAFWGGGGTANPGPGGR